MLAAKAEAEGAVQLFSRMSAVKRKKHQPSEMVADDPAPKRQQQEGGAAAVLPERAPGEDSNSESAASSFKELGVSDWLCSVLQSLGIRRPTQVQAGCIPAILAGKDVIGTAQTGSGKTAAFALPILQQLARDPYGIFALVLTPTRCCSCLLAVVPGQSSHGAVLNAVAAEDVKHVSISDYYLFQVTPGSAALRCGPCVDATFCC
eukprot:GHRQ01024132.1.p1 GENE.GHRQ01024132.1~~GHRQ01024132.1.p1  ORF type:complete len:205 (+),score=24.30 GHRQ01024132.1:647-1261(+)